MTHLSDPEGFLLLTIPSVRVVSTHPAEYPSLASGLLSLECVTVKVSSSPTATSPSSRAPSPSPISPHPAAPDNRDVWLVMRIDPSDDPHIIKTSSPDQGGIEIALPATQLIIHNRATHTYTFPLASSGSEATLTLTFPPVSDAAAEEDYETLEVILAQYAVLQNVSPPLTRPPGSVNTQSPFPPDHRGYQPFDTDGDLKGQLVLVNEENGQVIGTLSESIPLHADSALQNPPKGHEKDPVIIDIRDEGTSGGIAASPGVFVHPISVDESDFLMRTAGTISRGVVIATNLLASGLGTATNFYISKAKPSQDPAAFSPAAQRNIKRIHKVSGQAVKVTSATTGLIHKAVETLADRVVGRSTPAPPTRAATIAHPSAGYAPGTPGMPGFDAKGGLAPNPYPGQRAPSPEPRKKSRRPGLINRVLTSTDMLMTTIEQSGQHLISHGAHNLSRAVGHKYGAEAGRAVGLAGESVKNVAVVYIDVRGVGRRALIKSAGKRIVFGPKKDKNGKPVPVEGGLQQDVYLSEGGEIRLVDSADSKSGTMPGGLPPPYPPPYQPPPGGPPPPSLPPRSNTKW